MSSAQRARVLRCFRCRLFQAHQVGWAPGSPSGAAMAGGSWRGRGGPGLRPKPCPAARYWASLTPGSRTGSEDWVLVSLRNVLLLLLFVFNVSDVVIRFVETGGNGF